MGFAADSIENAGYDSLERSADGKGENGSGFGGYRRARCDQYKDSGKRNAGLLSECASSRLSILVRTGHLFATLIGTYPPTSFIL